MLHWTHLLAAAFAALLVAAALPAAAAEVTLLGDAWCPYNCDPGSDHPGYAVEVARAAFGATGRMVQYRTVTWTRSVAEVQAGHAQAVIGLTHRENSAFVFPHEPIGISALGLVTRDDSTFRYQGPRSLEGHVLGTVAGYGFNGPCGDYIRAHAADRSRVQVVSGDDALEKNLLKLQAGRIDVVVDDANVLAQRLAGMGRDAHLKLVGVTDADPVYIAFSPALPGSAMLAGALDSGIARMRASGELASILARYHLRDWK